MLGWVFEMKPGRYGARPLDGGRSDVCLAILPGAWVSDKADG